MAARLRESTRTTDPITSGRQRETKRETAKPEVFAGLFSRESLGMIGKISIDSRSKKRSLAQEPVPPGKRWTPSKGVTPAPVFAITSGKGGVGKTNIVANLAAALTLRKKRVMVIDADLGLANLDLFFGVRPSYTLADFFTGLVALNEIVIQNRHGILLLPGACETQEVTALRHDQKIALLRS